MWSRRSIEAFIGVSLLAVLAACSATPRHERTAPSVTAGAHSPAIGPGNSGAAGKAAQPGAGPGAQAAAGPPPVPAEAQAEFDKALALVRVGNDEAAEAQLTDLAHRYSQFSTPLVDLAILYRKGGNLDAATHALQQAVTRDPRSALAWTQLGVTQRLGGQFQAADQSYARAMAADPTYAPAYRDRGVLRDLYLDQPAAALGDFEQYRKLMGQDRLVAMWIAELQHRTGIKEPAAGGTPPRTAGVSAPSATPVSAVPASPPQARN
jgi:Flp pilus assembly protein TadD